jgi:hypothetical protein
MLSKLLAVAALSFALGLGLAPPQTPETMVNTYDSLADAILAVKHTEADFVHALVDGHMHAAGSLVRAGQWDEAAAQMALVASEGDNAIGGVRKRLLEGGHHHNAAGEAEGIYEPGFVVITRDVKQRALAAATNLRKARDDSARQAIWAEFEGYVKAEVGPGR